MSQLSDISAKALALMVNPQHLRPAALAKLRDVFGEGPNRHFVLDDFLAPHLLAPVRRMIAEDAAFEDNLKLLSKARGAKVPGDPTPLGKVDLATFESAPDDDRFICQMRVTGPKPGHAETSAVKAEQFIRDMLSSTPMHEWLSSVSGSTIVQTGGINLKLHGRGHFLRPHSDARQGRKLCAVIYLHEEWLPDFAGRFMLYLADGGEKRIDPLPNRMILFDTVCGNDHSIEAIGDIPEGWWRANYSVWFG